MMAVPTRQRRAEALSADELRARRVKLVRRIASDRAELADVDERLIQLGFEEAERQHGGADRGEET